MTDVRDEEDKRYQAVVDTELGEGFRQRAHKGESMTVGDVTGDMKSDRKAPKGRAHDEEACEINPVEVLGVQKQVRNAKVFSETAGRHRKKNGPAQQQDLVASKVGKQQLNREKVYNALKKIFQTSHKKVYIKLVKFFPFLKLDLKLGVSL